jgi:hypothetical protein
MRIMFITGFAAVALSAGSRAPEGAKVLSKPIHLRELVAESIACWPPPDRCAQRAGPRYTPGLPEADA